MLYLSAGQRSENILHIHNFNFNYGANTWRWVGCLNCDHTAELSAAAYSITVNTVPEPWQASPELSFPKQLYWATLRGSKSPKKFGWRCSRRCQARDHCSQQPVRCKGSVGRFWPIASTKCKFFLKFVWYWSCVVVQWHHRDVRFIWKL